jgi:hypothetical protein
MGDTYPKQVPNLPPPLEELREARNFLKESEWLPEVKGFSVGFNAYPRNCPT